MYEKDDSSKTESTDSLFKLPSNPNKSLMKTISETHNSLSSTSTRKSHSSHQHRFVPGYSTLDWEQLKRSSSFPSKIITPRLYITLSELQLHCHLHDAWIALNGKVYDITLYIPFHPGGKEIMKAAGKDGTKLLMSIHPWVNYECLLDKCWIGLLIYT